MAKDLRLGHVLWTECLRKLLGTMLEANVMAKCRPRHGGDAVAAPLGGRGNDSACGPQAHYNGITIMSVAAVTRAA